jgi:hypothetical protein
VEDTSPGRRPGPGGHARRPGTTTSRVRDVGRGKYPIICNYIITLIKSSFSSNYPSDGVANSRKNCNLL